MTERIVEMMDVVIYGGALQQIPNADKIGEEIIRCKDCEYLEEDDSKWRCSNLEFYIDFVCGEKPNGFCKWGERKEK